MSLVTYHHKRTQRLLIIQRRSKKNQKLKINRVRTKVSKINILTSKDFAKMYTLRKNYKFLLKERREVKLQILDRLKMSIVQINNQTIEN
jgi:hypothetical protein